ncbi:MAG: hypothetical protein DRI99_02915 [Candidatus Aminicenantes bacterium]|nr:MAG: hypothetical protein DRI99_02915 [Candidatus Aminicenantes bacterium]
MKSSIILGQTFTFQMGSLGSHSGEISYFESFRFSSGWSSPFPGGQLWREVVIILGSGARL